MENDNFDDETRDERRKRLSNERQKRYYQKNKGHITSNFQKKRDELKCCSKKLKRAKRQLRGQVPALPVPVAEPEPEPEPEPVAEPEPVPEPEPEINMVMTIV